MINKNKIASFVALTCCMVGSMALAAKPRQVVSQFDVLAVYPRDFENGKTEAQIQALKNRIRRQIMTANYINHQPGGVPLDYKVLDVVPVARDQINPYAKSFRDSSYAGSVLAQLNKNPDLKAELGYAEADMVTYFTPANFYSRNQRDQFAGLSTLASSRSHHAPMNSVVNLALPSSLDMSKRFHYQGFSGYWTTDWSLVLYLNTTTFAHEAAHSFGAEHDQQTRLIEGDRGAPLNPLARGFGSATAGGVIGCDSIMHKNLRGRRVSVEAYRFSNPNQQCNGQAMGDASTANNHKYLTNAVHRHSKASLIHNFSSRLSEQDKASIEAILAMSYWRALMQQAVGHDVLENRLQAIVSGLIHYAATLNPEEFSMTVEQMNDILVYLEDYSEGFLDGDANEVHQKLKPLVTLAVQVQQGKLTFADLKAKIMAVDALTLDSGMALEDQVSHEQEKPLPKPDIEQGSNNHTGQEIIEKPVVPETKPILPEPPTA